MRRYYKNKGLVLVMTLLLLLLLTTLVMASFEIAAIEIKMSHAFAAMAAGR